MRVHIHSQKRIVEDSLGISFPLAIQRNRRHCVWMPVCVMMAPVRNKRNTDVFELCRNLTSFSAPFFFSFSFFFILSHFQHCRISHPVCSTFRTVHKGNFYTGFSVIFLPLTPALPKFWQQVFYGEWRNPDHNFCVINTLRNTYEIQVCW